jgi:hypothetical protein
MYSAVMKKSQEERDRLPQLVLEAANPQAKSNSISSSRELAETMSVIGTKKEYIRAITSSPEEQDMNFMKNLATFVAAKHPEYAETMGTPERLTGFFAQVSNLLTADQIAALRDTLDAEGDVPLEESICLTEDEQKQWNKDRANALENAGLDPEIAKDFVDRQNERRKSDLADIAEILAKGPENMIGDAINNAINSTPADPDCKVSKSVTQLNKNDRVKEVMTKATDVMFKRLESAFIDDVILWRWPFDPRGWADGPGILSKILGDKEGYTLNFHYVSRENIFFKMLRFMTFLQFPKREEFPSTVGIEYKNKLDELEPNTSGDKLSLTVSYKITDDYKWKSKTVITNDFKVNSEEHGSIYNRSFDYKYKQKSPENSVGTFVVERIQSKSFTKWLKKNKLSATNSELKLRPYKNVTFNKYMKSIYSDFSNIEIANGLSDKVLKKLEHIATTKFLSRLTPESAFGHGSSGGEIEAKHLEYVGPGGEEYDFDEDEAVFGKPKSKHPRVKFLDPAKYGGSYSSPKVYIRPPKHTGLMKLSKVFLPDMESGCETKIGETHFLFLNDIKDKIDKARSSITTHKKLNFAPDCVKEIPYDKIANPATLANLEGSIIATIRVYLSHFFIKTMPIWSGIDFGSNDGVNLRNFDELMAEYVVSLMKRGLISETSLFARATYEGYPYWLMFLEQVAQTVQRRVKNGDIEETKDIKKSFMLINDIQEKHIVPSVDGMLRIANQYEDKEITETMLDNDYEAELVVKGGALIGGIMDRGDLPSGAGGSFGTLAWSAFNLNSAKFAAKIYSLHLGRAPAINLLKYLVAEEISFYRKKISTKLTQLDMRPQFFDIKKTFIGTHGVALGNTVNSGLWETESPESGGNSPYGDINNVSSNPIEKHSLSGKSIPTKEYDFLRENGGIYLEKYLRIFDRKSSAAQRSASEIPIPEFITNRDDHLRGVVNILDFKKFLQENKDLIPEEMKVSDAFLYQDKEGEKESAGIMFGVRLCYIPPKGYNPFGDDPPNNLKALAMREKSFLNAPMTFSVESIEQIPNPNYVSQAQAAGEDAGSETAIGGDTTAAMIAAAALAAASSVPETISQSVTEIKTLQNSKYSFPLVNYEAPLNDVMLKELLNTDDNLNQDIKCYIDSMVAMEEFEFIFDKCINLRRSASLLMVTTYDSWLPSIGAVGSGERNEVEVAKEYEDQEEEQPTYTDGASSDYFNDSRKECRKMFIKNYKRRDFDPPDEEEDFDFVKDNLNRMLSETYSAVLYSDDVPFWMKWRVIRDNPDDEEGNPCGNAFTKLFSK